VIEEEIIAGVKIIIIIISKRKNGRCYVGQKKR